MSDANQEKTYAFFPNASNRQLIARLEESGKSVLRIPPPEIRPVNSEPNSAVVKNTLSEFDWIIFPDVLAVDYFLKIFEENEIDFFELDEKRVLALGEAVADQLRFVQLHADIIPKTLDSETVFSTLANYLEADGFGDLHFLVPKAECFNFELKQNIQNKGAKVAEMIVYRLEVKEKSELGRIKALLRGGAVDDIVLTSPIEVIFLKHLFDSGRLREILTDTKISGIDEITINILRENNLPSRFFRS